MNFLSSPEIVTAMAFAGRLSFNPMTDSLTDANGKPFKFEPPTGIQLPQNGFTSGRIYSFTLRRTSHPYVPSSPKGDLSYAPSPLPPPQPETEVQISPESTRLEVLEAFSKEFPNSRGMELPPLTTLMRVRGKCTTDHISAAVSTLPLIPCEHSSI